MLTYPAIDPVAFTIFTWPVHWYGLMYLFGFLLGWGLLALRIRHHSRGFTQDELSDLCFYAAIGAIVGGRLGYMLFYDWPVLLSEPSMLFQTWKGGMYSFSKLSRRRM